MQFSSFRFVLLLGRGVDGSALSRSEGTGAVLERFRVCRRTVRGRVWTGPSSPGPAVSKYPYRRLFRQIHMVPARGKPFGRLEIPELVKIFNNTVKGLRGKTEVWCHTCWGNPAQSASSATCRATSRLWRR